MKKFLFTIICTLFPILASAQEPYAVLSDDNTVLTFYYDDQKAERSGMDVGPFTYDKETGTVNSGWNDQRESIEQVVFDDSFASCTTITSTSYWFWLFSKLTTITDLKNLKTDNVTEMKDMFRACSHLKSLDVSGFNTSKVTNMEAMFYGCSLLKSLDVSRFDTSNVTNMSYMFEDCSGLTSLDVSGFNTSNVTTMSSMFKGCKSLTNLNLSGFNTNNVRWMDRMFWWCESLEILDLSAFNTENVYDMFRMFGSCHSIKSLDLSGFNTNKVYNMGHMFEYCESLETLDLSTFNIENVENMEYMFGECTSLKSLDLSGFGTNKATDMGGMFYGCNNLTSLDLSRLNTENVLKMWEMFYGCSSLTTLDLSGFNTENVSNMSSMFQNDYSLTTIYVGKGWSTDNITSEDAGANMFTMCVVLVGGEGTALDADHIDYTYAHVDEGKSNPGYFTFLRSGKEEPYAVLSKNNTTLTFYYDDIKTPRMDVGPFTFDDENYTVNSGWYEQSENIEQVVFDESFANCTTITSTSYWFYRFWDLTTITGLENLKTDNVTDMSYMFDGCSQLTTLDVSGFDTSKATNISYMFEGCSSLTTLDVSGFDTSKTTNMDGIFSGCSSLTSLDVSGFNTSNLTTMSRIFDDCSSLTSLDLSGFDTSNVTNMSHMFSSCRALASLDLSGFDTSKVTDMSGMFSGWGLANLDLSGFDTSKVTDMSSMFARCDSISLDLSSFNTENVTSFKRMFENSNLKSLDLSNFNTEKATTMEEMFCECESLTSLDVSSFNTANVTDMSAMFAECSNMETLNLGNFNTANVTDMREMFAECSKMETLYLGNFNTANVTRIKRMFDRDSLLTTIYVGEGWSTENISSEDGGADMFRGCVSLVGGEGTTFDENHVDYTYAHVDEGESNPGYFTLSRSGGEIEPYAILIDDGTALEFRYDDMKSAYRDAMDIGPFTEAIQRGWESSAEGIKSVVFNESFAKCSTITSTAYWFAGLSNLETFVGLEYLNTSNVTNMYMMFYNCTSLASLDLSYFNTENVTDMSVMFGSCNALTTIIVGSDWTTDHVEESGAMFESCFNLVGGNGTTFSQMNTDASYAHIDTEGYPGYFTASSSGDEPYWQELNYAIEHGTEILEQARDSGKVDQRLLEELDTTLEQANEMYKIHEAEEDEVRNMTDELNARINKVEEAMKGGGEASEETWEKLQSTIDYGSEILSQARESSKVDQWLIEELEMTLDNAHEMEKEHTASEEEVLNMTEDLEWRIHEVEEAMKGGGEEEPYAVLSEDNSVLTFYYDDQKDARGGMDVGPFEDGGRTSGSGWSEFNEQITTVVFDESFANCTTLTSTAYWFYGCENLTTITDFKNLKTDNVTDINSMFSDCHSLTSIDFSSLNLSNVTNMSQVFEDCRTLESINFRGVNTENVTDMSDLFLNCHNLRTIDLSSFNTRNVTNMSHMFCRCDSLTTIYVGEGWNTENVTESDQMFERSANLVGGLGTTYDPDHIDIEYAHIDGGVDNPGYLTGINEREAYFDGLTAWVYGDATLNDAFAAVGREAAVQTVAAIVWEANGELTSEQLEGITNPNLLVYVNEASKAPADVQNVIIEGVAEEIILTDATGNNNFYCPQPFTAKSISYSRDFSQTTELEVSRGWETIALPFDVQSISHESHGNLIPFGGEDNGYHFWLRQLSEEGLERATQIEANKPYLISMPNNTIYPSVYNQNGVVTFSSTDVTVPETNPQSDAYADVTLHAAFQQVEQGSDVYALNVGEARGEYPEGSVFEQNYRDIRPFQAYTTHRAGTRFIPLGSLGDKDGATGINELRVENGEKKENAWYSLDGRRLYVKPTKKGVYVKDGQKIVIK